MGLGASYTSCGIICASIMYYIISTTAAAQIMIISHAMTVTWHFCCS